MIQATTYQTILFVLAAAFGILFALMVIKYFTKL